MKDFLQQALISNNFKIATELQNQLHHYLNLLKDWNAVYNLTAIRDPHKMVMLHIIDSLVITPYLHGNRLIDVGSGAGLPGIPLALTQPDKYFVLLDSNSKKTHFLTQAVLELQLKNVEVMHSRCEDFHPETGFDSILSRAFAAIPDMLEQTQHLAAPDGQFLAMKGVYPELELKKIPKQFHVVKVQDLTIHGLDAQRCLVIIGKRS